MNDKLVAFRINKDFHSHIVMESHRISIERNENLTVSDLIREAIEEKYPITSKEKGDDKR